MAKSNISR